MTTEMTCQEIKYNSGMPKCAPGCTCKRHSRVSKPCPPNCTCRRHSIPQERRMKMGNSRKGRPLSEAHRAALKCAEGCTCGKHTLRNSGQFKPGDKAGRSCAPGCTCGRHVKKSGYKHTEEAKARIGAASKARVRSPFTDDQKARISAATRDAMQRPDVQQRHRDGLAVALSTPEYRAKRAQLTAKMYAEGKIGRFNGPSKPQLMLRDLIEEAGYRTELEVPFDRAVVDIYLPDIHLAVEADGVYWHSVKEQEDPGYYGRRDRFLLLRYKLRTIRFTDAEIKNLTSARVAEVIANG